MAVDRAQGLEFSRYLPAESDALRWGLYVVDCGFGTIAPHADYPGSTTGHPVEYVFSWDSGRILQEYQLVYISEGRGTFESEPSGRCRVEAGHVFLVFPGVWHRFRPLPAVGWQENWIGFGGDVADRIMQQFFSPEKPLIRVGHDYELQDLIRSISGLANEAPPGYQQVVGARTMLALAHVRSRTMSLRPVDREVAKKVQEARHYLATHYDQKVDLEKLARRLGMSYSRFRMLFKAHTGVAPHQYLLDVRLNLARHWLTDSNLTVSEIADRLGFSTVYYFSRLFKKRTGASPSTYRRR